MNPYEASLLLNVMAKRDETGPVDTFVPLDGHELDDLPTDGYWVRGERPAYTARVDEMDRGEVAWYVGGTRSQFFFLGMESGSEFVFIWPVNHMNSKVDAIDLAKSRGHLDIYHIDKGEWMTFAD